MFNFLKSQRKDVKEYLKDLRNTQSSNSIRNNQQNSFSPLAGGVAQPSLSPAANTNNASEINRKNKIYSQVDNEDSMGFREMRDSRQPPFLEERKVRMNYGSMGQYNNMGYSMPPYPQYSFMYPTYPMEPFASQSYMCPAPPPQYQNPLKVSRSMSNVVQNSQQSKFQKGSSMQSKKSKMEESIVCQKKKKTKKPQVKQIKKDTSTSKKQIQKQSHKSKLQKMEEEEQDNVRLQTPAVPRTSRNKKLTNPLSASLCKTKNEDLQQAVNKYLKPLIDETDRIYNKKCEKVLQTRRKLTRLQNLGSNNGHLKDNIGCIEKWQSLVEIPASLNEKHEQIMSLISHLRKQFDV